MTVTISVKPPNQVASQKELQIPETQELTETTTTATDTQQQSAASRTYSTDKSVFVATVCFKIIQFYGKYRKSFKKWCARPKTAQGQ